MSLKVTASVRNCTLVTYLKHPVTGEDLIRPDFADVLERHKREIDGYIWIIHDKDKVLEANYKFYQKRLKELEKDRPGDPLCAYYRDKKVGDDIPPHVHIILHFKDSVKIGRIAKWFGTYVQCFGKGSGEKRQLLHSIGYLLHRRPVGCQKYQYDEDELHASKGLMEEYVSYGNDVGFDEKATLINAVNEIRSGMSLAEIRQKYPAYFFISNLQKLRAAAEDYILYEKPLPKHLINIYIYGPSGSGKTTLAKAISRELYPNDELPYYNVGGAGVALQTYRCEPVVLWNDFDAGRLLDVAKNGDLYELLEPHGRERVARSIKYGSVVLFQSVNIFTSKNSDNKVKKYADYRDFFDDLGQEKGVQDKQIYRRFQVVIEVQDDHIDIKVNRLLLDRNSSASTETDTDVFFYDTVVSVDCSITDIMEQATEELRDEMLSEIAKPAVIAIRAIQKKYEDQKHPYFEEKWELMSTVSIKNVSDDTIFGGELIAWKENFDLMRDKEEEDAMAYYDSMIPDDSELREARHALISPEWIW